MACNDCTLCIMHFNETHLLFGVRLTLPKGTAPKTILNFKYIPFSPHKEQHLKSASASVCEQIITSPCL